MDVFFREEAESDLSSISNYIALDNPARALSFIRELRNQCMKLGDFPLAWPARPEIAEDLRIMIFRGYLICYTPHPDKVVIERISEGSRDISALFQ